MPHRRMTCSSLKRNRPPLPKRFDNRSFDANADLWREVRGCKQANNCTHCGKCAALMKAVFI